MTKINNNETPTYTTVKVNGKQRRVRRFGAVTFTDKNGRQKIIREAEYLFIKNEPKTIYTRDIHDCVNIKKKNANVQL